MLSLSRSYQVQSNRLYIRCFKSDYINGQLLIVETQNAETQKERVEENREQKRGQ